MSPAPMLKIKSVDAKPNYRLLVSWSTGGRATIDFANVISKGGVFAALKDSSLFRQVRVGERRRTIEWPQPADDLGYPIIDIDAESLLTMYNSQKQSVLIGKLQSAARSLVSGPQTDRQKAV